MKKRSAIVIAAGLSLAMVTAAFGIMMGFTGPSEAGSRVSVAKHRKPVVKTVTEKHTVHIQAPGGSGGGGTTTVITQTQTPAPAPAANEGDDGQGTSTSGDGNEPVEQETETPEPSDTHSESEPPEPQNDD